jgi:pilus assembly protein CpaC
VKRYLLNVPLLLALVPADAFAHAAVRVRVGDHGERARVVFDWPRPTTYRVEEAETGRVLLHFGRSAEFDLSRAAMPGRHLHGIEVVEGRTAALATSPGARVRHFRLGGRVVVDVADTATPGLPGVVLAQAPADMAQVVAMPRTAAEPTLTIAQAGPALPGRGAAMQPLQPTAPQPATTLAQATAPRSPAAATPAPTAVPLRLEAGTGRLLTLGAPAATVMAADPRIARVQPSSPTSVFIMAVGPGRTTVIATSELGQPVAEYDITVVGGSSTGAPAGERREGESTAARPINASGIEAQIRALLSGPGQVRVRANGRSLVLTGTVATATDARRAEAIARGMANEDTEILNELSVLGSIQVNLRVRVAEISRDVTRSFGFNWQALGNNGPFLFGLRTGASAGFLTPAIVGSTVGSTLTTPQRLGFQYRNGGSDVNGIIDALASDNLVTILAEPNLTAQSGEVASFLAGGEFPVPVSARENTISVEFKSFGVSLTFVPTVLASDRLVLRVRPEVSELTDQGAVNLPFAGGTLRIPALSVRRAETTIELGSGQSFAIAGLLQRNSSQANDGLNGLADIPVLGPLFRSDRFQRRETELVIIVTPYLVQPVSDPRALVAPTDSYRPATSLERILNQRQLTSRPPVQVPDGVGFRFQ